MKDYQTESQRAFDRQAPVYDTSGYSRHAQALYPVVLAQLAQVPHRSVLDLGCGTGALLAAILGRWPETDCTGLDLSEGMLGEARRKLGSRARLVQGEAATLPFADGSFEVVVCTDSFHHYPQPERVLEEVRRVLRPGGVFLLADTTAPAPVRGVLNCLLPWGHSGDVRLYGPKEVSALLGRFFQGAECRRRNAVSFLAWGIR